MRHFRSAASGLLVLLLAGCSGGQARYDYAIPDGICGVGVSVSRIKPLLPPGKEVREISSKPVRVGASKSCSLVVDKKEDLTVSFSRQTGELDIAYEAEGKYIDLKRVSLGGVVNSAAVADDGAVAWMACSPKPNQPQYEMPEAKQGRYSHLVLEVHAGDGVKEPENIEEWRAHIEKFLRAYVPELVKVWCSG